MITLWESKYATCTIQLALIWFYRMKIVIARIICFPRCGWDSLAFMCARAWCLNCKPSINLGLSGIYSKAGRFFGSQELCSVQPLRCWVMPVFLGICRAANWIPLAIRQTDGYRERKNLSRISVCMQTPGHKLSPDQTLYQVELRRIVCSFRMIERWSW